MLKKLYLQDYRNYSELEITFSPDVNWIIGNNAQGKTNILEAVYLLSCGRSFRTSQLSQLIRKESEQFYIEAYFEKDGVNQSIKLFYGSEFKRLKINSTTYSHFTPLIGLMPMVLYAPEDSTLVNGAPACRRKFLDLHLSQIDPLYLHHLARYHRALKQRNELLKNHKENLIDTWEEMMAPSAAYLMQKRADLIHLLKSPLQTMMKNFSSGADELSIQYQPSFSLGTQEKIIAQLYNQRKKELHIGSTLLGPHRDDFLFSIGNLSAKSYASVGQKHSIIAALRLCIWEHLKQQLGSPPLIGIDDFGAHLDDRRQERFVEQFKGLGQIFLTSPSAKEGIFPVGLLLEVELGKVIQESCT